MTVTATATNAADAPVSRPADTVGRGGHGARRAFPVGYVVLIVILAALAGWLLWRAKWQTYHFAAVQDGVLYRDGNRGLREFEHAVTRAKIKTVVPLIDDSELSDREKP